MFFPNKTLICTNLHTYWLTHSLAQLLVVLWRSAAVRLVGGSTYGEGRVNVFNDVTGQWMPVCASGWTKADADVVCRQLGFFSGAATGSSFTTDLVE